MYHRFDALYKPAGIPPLNVSFPSSLPTFRYGYDKPFKILATVMNLNNNLLIHYYNWTSITNATHDFYGPVKATSTNFELESLFMIVNPLLSI